MGYRGKLSDREEARRLRALGNVPVERGPRRRRQPREPLERPKAAEIADLLDVGRARIGRMSERDVLIAGVARYAGEASKTGPAVGFANTDWRTVALFCAWFRHFFDIDESRPRLRLCLHDGLDLDAAMHFWSTVTGIPFQQFRLPHRTEANSIRRLHEHEYGCISVMYSCSRTHREVPASCRRCYARRFFRGSSIGRAAAC